MNTENRQQKYDKTPKHEQNKQNVVECSNTRCSMQLCFSMSTEFFLTCKTITHSSSFFLYFFVVALSIKCEKITSAVLYARYEHKSPRCFSIKYYIWAIWGFVWWTSFMQIVDDIVMMMIHLSCHATIQSNSIQFNWMQSQMRSQLHVLQATNLWSRQHVILFDLNSCLNEPGAASNEEWMRRRTGWSCLRLSIFFFLILIFFSFTGCGWSWASPIRRSLQKRNLCGYSLLSVSKLNLKQLEVPFELKTMLVCLDFSLS